jgi:hypothetical protein
MEASAMAAETHSFAASWGSRLARQWTAGWVKRRVLPESDRGRHAKTWSLLNDPEIKEELSAYLRTNKWSMNPEKLVEYSKSKLVTDEMKKFVQNAVNKEMPRGLKNTLNRSSSFVSVTRWSVEFLCPQRVNGFMSKALSIPKSRRGFFTMDMSAQTMSTIAKMSLFLPLTCYGRTSWNIEQTIWSSWS